MSWYGLTEEENEAAIEDARRLLIRRAKRGQGPITYEELYARLTKPPEPMFRSVGQLLYWVGERETQAGRPPLSALVLRATDHLPGDGFWGLLNHIGYDVSNRPVSWAMTLMTVYAYWYRAVEADSEVEG